MQAARLSRIALCPAGLTKTGNRLKTTRLLCAALALASAWLSLPAIAEAEAAHPDASTSTPVRPGFDEQRYNREMDDYLRTHPNDFVGADRLSQSLGTGPLSWTFPGANLVGVSATQAQAAYDQARRASAFVATGQRESADLGEVPADAFSINAAAGIIQRTGEYVVQGSWNFRDTFYTGQDPDDAAKLSAMGTCWLIRGTYWSIYDRNGLNFSSTGRIAGAEAGSGSTLLAMNDYVIGQRLTNDNGNLRYFVRRRASCWDNSMQFSFQFEHNQGGLSWSGFSIGWRSFKLNYTRATNKYQDSTPIMTATG
jgi:hypothetical protein